MKKLICSISFIKIPELALMALLVSAYPTYASITEHKIEFHPETINFVYAGKYVQLDVEDLDKTANPGEPAIPYILTKLLIPSNESIDSVKISAEYSELPGYYLIDYAKNLIKTSVLESGSPETNPDPNIYSMNNRYPAEDYVIIDEGYFGANHIVSVAVFPIVYYPAARRLEVLDDLNIKIFTGTNFARSASLPDSRPVAEEILQELVDNYEDAPQHVYAIPQTMLREPNLYSPAIDGGLGYEYVVITSSALVGSFEELVEWKKRKGLVAGIVTVEEIDSEYPGVDIQEKIRNYLIDAYEYNLTWVLLGGDETIIPIRYAYHNNTSVPKTRLSQQICDLYYSDLTGVWEVDGDGVYGEPTQDNPDIYPEVYVGRLPASSPEEVEAYIEKLKIYEQNPGNGNYSYLTSALFIAADQLVSGNQHIILGNEMPGNFFVDTASCAERPSGSSQNPTSPTGQQVLEKMNEGFGFISNLNHGSPMHYAAMTTGYNGGPKSYVVSDVYYGDNHAALTQLEENYKFGVHYSISCDVSAIDMDRGVWPFPFPTDACLGEAYVNLSNKGGVSFLGNSRYGYVSISYRLEQEFIRCLFGDNPFARHVGVAEALSKLTYMSYRHINYGHLLYGDPEMMVWDRIPRLMTVSFDPEIILSSCSYLVEVKSYGEPVKNAKVCLYKSDDVFVVGYTSDDGKILFDIEPATGGIIHLTVTGDGYIPYLGEVTILPGTGIDNEDLNGLTEFKLIGNYPNPFNGATVIEYALDKAADVRLSVYNIGGRLVGKENYGNQSAGSQTLQWEARNVDGDELASGVYFYRLMADEKVKVGKMILVK